MKLVQRTLSNGEQELALEPYGLGVTVILDNGTEFILSEEHGHLRLSTQGFSGLIIKPIVSNVVAISAA